jgi:hypothetical protein
MTEVLRVGGEEGRREEGVKSVWFRKKVSFQAHLFGTADTLASFRRIRSDGLMNREDRVSNMIWKDQRMERLAVTVTRQFML